MHRATYLLILLLVVLFESACTKNADTDALNQKIATLSQTLELAKPGLGEIMSGIQLHHEKLFFAGDNENWALANYEIGEIEENLDRGTKLNNKIDNVEAPLTDLRHMTDASFDAVKRAISKKSKEEFTTQFASLTQACNSCHQAAKHGFIRVVVPQTLNITNQDFSK